MSFLLLLLVNLFLSTNGRLIQQSFHSIEWKSYTSTDVATDTLAVREIELHADNSRIPTIPTVDGWGNTQWQYLIDRDYDSSAFPIESTISVKWEWEEPQPVDYIEIISNCGDNIPSEFCANSNFTFLLNGNNQVVPKPITADRFYIKLYYFDDDCDNNTLILDQYSEPICDIKCNKCLTYIHTKDNAAINEKDVNYHKKIQYSSSVIKSVNSYTVNGSVCECPAYPIELINNYTFNINDNDAQSIVQNGNQNRVQVTLRSWMDADVTCRLMYRPNTDDFIGIPYQRALEITMTFSHSFEPLFEEGMNDTITEDFELEVADALDDTLNMQWIYSVNIYASNISTHSLNGIPQYNNTIIILSNDQKTTRSTRSIYVQWILQSDNLTATASLFIADFFDTDIQNLNNFTCVKDVLDGPDGGCESNWLYKPILTTTAPSIGKEEAIKVIIVTIIASIAFIIFAIGIIYLCYRKELGPFKKKWVKQNSKHPDDDTLGLDEVKIYADQKPLDKKKDNKKNSKPVTKHLSPKKQLVNTESIPMDKHLVIGGKPRLPKQDVSRHVLTLTDQSTGDPSVYMSAPSLRGANVNDLTVQRQSNTFQTKSNTLRIHPSQYSYQHTTDISGDTAYERKNSQRTSGGKMSLYDNTHNSEYQVLPQTSDQSTTPPAGIIIGDNNKHVINQSVIIGNTAIDLKKRNTGKGITPINGNTPTNNFDIKPIMKIAGNNSMLLDDIKQATDNNRIYEFKDLHAEIKLLKIIGEGSFGKVWKAKWDVNEVAVKIFNINNNNNNISNNNNKSMGTGMSLGHKGGGGKQLGIEMSSITSLDDETYKELYAEIILATSIPYHPNIVRIMGFCKNPISVVMEYMPGGSVQKLVYGLTMQKEPSVSEKLIILLKSCSGLKELTRHNLHHRDVAARNILLGSYDTEINIDTAVKITDFGMTRKDDDAHSGNNAINQKTKNDGGPYKWMAPESIQNREYNEKTDVYMFAITMWEIMYGREPYENVDAINAAMQVCMKNERPEFLWDLPYGLETLMKKCWSPDPDIRFTFSDIFTKLNTIKQSHQHQMEEQTEMDQQIENQTTITSQ